MRHFFRIRRPASPTSGARRWLPTATAGLLLSPAPLRAAAADGADTAWMLTASALVLFMTVPGLALFYGGLVRTKNVLSVLMQCFAITCGASLLWFTAGYSLAFTDGGLTNAWLGGVDRVLLAGITRDSLSGSIPEALFTLFQMTFAIITPALVIGGFAERMKFSAMLLFSMLWLLVVYVPVAHWVWGGGWLMQRGVLDFAGGIVVHTTAGVGALVAALVIGPRRGFGSQALAPHSLPLTVAGAGMLWVGWYGFNGGSALAASGGASMAILVTHLAAAAGALAWMAMEWLRHGKPSVLGIVTGLVAGLGTITPASGFVGPGGALVIGLTAGVICYFATQWLKQRLRIDDSLDVFPVHGVGGMLGTLLAGILASGELGLLSGHGYAGDMTMGRQVGVQVTGILSVAAFTGLATWALLKLADALLGLRVTTDQETEGLDLTQHDERGYDL